MSPADGPLVPADGAGGLSPEALAANIARAIPAGSAICVGFSGGLDSTVLLEILAERPELSGYRVSALHVHHGLSPNADKWVKFCERFCANHGVALTVEHARVDRESPLGLEGAARAARYALYAGRPEPYVALAHHLDDQAETVLLQLLRGTGIKGIAAMPGLRLLRGTHVHVFRPLLDCSRAQLRAYAEERGLRWIEDESNEDAAHDRNYLRHGVAPLLDARFQGWRQALARFARHAGAAGELLDALAAADGVPARGGEPLPLRSELSAERRANVLRAYLARNAVAMPSEARLADMARQLYDAREDARVRIDHAGVSLVRHRGSVLIERGLAAERGPWRVEWKREAELALGADRGTIHFEPVTGAGIAEALAAEGEWHVGPRCGGETIRLDVERPTRTLKNLLQEGDMPLWHREKLPLLFHDGRLVWVPGIGIAVDYACRHGEKGLRPSWRVAGEAPLC